MSDQHISGPGPEATAVTGLCLRSGADTWTNMPAAGTEYLGLTVHRVQLDVTGFTLARLQVQVSTAGLSGATLAAQCTTDLTGATGWVALTPTAVLTAAGLAVSAWGAVPTGMDVALVRLWGTLGDGVVDPVIAGVFLNLTS